MSDVVPAGRPGALAQLAVTGGPRAGEALSVPAPVVVLGREAACDVVIDDDSVSARHARLEYDGGWHVTDLGSVNGTAVDGTRLAPEIPAPLPYGAALRLGGVRLEFQPAADVADDALQAAASAHVPRQAPRTLREERRGARFPVWLALVLLVIAVAVGIFVYFALVAEHPVERLAVPWFTSDDIDALARFVADHFALTPASGFDNQRFGITIT